MRVQCIFLGWLAGFAGAGEVRAATNANCAAPDMLILLDVSGSMKSNNKYSQAVTAIDTATQATEANLRYGLMLFPEPGAYPVYCGIGTELAVEPDLYNWDPIYRKISPTLYPGNTANPEYFGGPRGDFDTPMYQALDFASQVSAFGDGGRRHYVLLLTDGVQDCCRGDDYDNEKDCDLTKPYPNYFYADEYDENRQDLIDLVTAMHANDVATFVVGFGSGVDAVTLDALAEAGGTAISGCSGAGDCYYQANDAAELTDALEAIAQIVGVETCDGIDNDCDGAVDDNVSKTCSTACGSGLERCAGGSYAACDAPTPATENCDGLDNDCDGDVDETCTCVHGESQACGSATGLCEPGTQTCATGTWGVCLGGLAAGEEICSGRDDEDCDGEVDEGCACLNGLTQPCGTDVGACSPGTQRCLDGQWAACVGAMTPTAEACDGLDNDCDGDTDEYCDCDDGDVRACGSSLGVCEAGEQTCTAGLWNDCTGATIPGAESCNHLDDDCDGAVDNGEICKEALLCRCGACVQSCGVDATCPADSTCRQGACVTNTCPEGMICDGLACVPGTETPEVVPKVPQGGVQRGCQCRTNNAAYGLLLVAALIIRRRTH